MTAHHSDPGAAAGRVYEDTRRPIPWDDPRELRALTNARKAVVCFLTHIIPQLQTRPMKTSVSRESWDDKMDP